MLEKRQSKAERPLTCLSFESNRPCASSSSWKIPKYLRALDFTECRRDTCDARIPAHTGEEYSITLWTKTLLTVGTGEQHCNVIGPRKVMADGEAYKFKRQPGVGLVVMVVAWDPRVLSSSPVGR